MLKRGEIERVQNSNVTMIIYFFCIVSSSSCVFCGNVVEDHDCLIFDCEYCGRIWKALCEN